MLLLVALLYIHLVRGEVLYVGEDEYSCAGVRPCETLQSYASNRSKYFTSNSSFEFLPGNHILSESIHVYGVTDIAFTSFSPSEGSVSIECIGTNSGLIFEKVTNVSLAYLLFYNCSQFLPNRLHRENETARATLAFGEVKNANIELVSVYNSAGYGLLGHCVYGTFFITNSTFSLNHGTAWHLGGNAAMEYINCSDPEYYGSIGSTLHIEHSSFTNGSYTDFNYTEYTGTLATGLSVVLSHSNITVLLSHLLLEGNANRKTHKGFGGNLFIHFYGSPRPIFSTQVEVSDCVLLDGSALYGAGIAVSAYSYSTKSCGNSCKNSVLVSRTVISQNKGVFGSGLNVQHVISSDSKSVNFNIDVVNSTFRGNELVLPDNTVAPSYLGNGVAVHMTSQYTNRGVDIVSKESFRSNFDTCTFTSSKFLHSHTSLTSVGIVFAVANQETVWLKDCQFLSNSFTALGAYRAKISVNGSLRIHKNRGINGGGLLLCQSSFIILTESTVISLMNNYAVQFGGAIYVEGECLRSKPHCFYQFQHSSTNCNDTRLSQHAQIYMINNTAGHAGEHIYGGALDNCYISVCKSSEVFRSLFKYNNRSFSSITSDPIKICFCSEGIPDCEKRTLTYETSVYPGSSIEVYAVVVGQFNGTVPGTIVTYSRSIKQQESFTTRKNCTLLNISMRTEESGEIEIYLNLNNVSFLSEQRKISVFVEPCPLGFKFNVTHNICVCDPVLQAHKVFCDIKSQQVQRVPPGWIGFDETDDYRDIIYHEVCPYEYCHGNDTFIFSNNTYFDQDSQCASRRTGLLCSKCKDGFGLSIGTADCSACDPRVTIPLSVFGFLLLGILLVLFLAAFNVSYSEGYFSGLLFYANAVYVNSYHFFQPEPFKVLHVVISWMNLSSGFPFCLHRGIDAYMKVWLNFCFPIYLFFISGIIVVLCRASKRISRMFSANIVKVLTTLFQFSYTSLLHSVVVALSFTQMQFPVSSENRTAVDSRLVWLADPSLDYFQGKHIPLGLTAIAIGLFIVVYTLILLFIQPLQRYSHLCCFKWVAKVKPLVDTYTSPHVIQDNCRYWEGLLLLFRLVMSIIFTSNVQGRKDINLVTISTASLLILSIAWSINGVYKKWELKILNAVSFFNLAALSVLTTQSYQPLYASVVTNVSFGVAVLLLLAILSYSIFMKMKLLCPRAFVKRQPTLLEATDSYMAFRLNDKI